MFQTAGYIVNENFNYSLKWWIVKPHFVLVLSGNFQERSPSHPTSWPSQWVLHWFLALLYVLSSKYHLINFHFQMVFSGRKKTKTYRNQNDHNVLLLDFMSIYVKWKHTLLCCTFSYIIHTMLFLVMIFFGLFSNAQAFAVTKINHNCTKLIQTPITFNLTVIFCI